MTAPGSFGEADEYDRLRRRVLWSLPTGLFVVGSRSGDRRNLMTGNWVMQVATAPKLVAVALESGSVTRTLVEEGGGFSVTVLNRSDRAVVRRFVKPADEVVVDGDGVAVTIQGEPVHEVAGGLPVLAVAHAWLACELRRLVQWDEVTGAPADGASHVLAVGEVVAAGEVPAAEGTDGAEGPAEILRMEDTRMNYGG